MKGNESNLDRVIRVVLGIVLLALNLGGVVTGSLGIVLLVVGALSFVTGLIGFARCTRCSEFAPRRPKIY